jgi:hypothetical protein
VTEASLHVSLGQCSAGTGQDAQYSIDYGLADCSYSKRSVLPSVVPGWLVVGCRGVGPYHSQLDTIIRGKYIVFVCLAPGQTAKDRRLRFRNMHSPHLGCSQGQNKQ